MKKIKKVTDSKDLRIWTEPLDKITFLKGRIKSCSTVPTQSHLEVNKWLEGFIETTLYD